MRRSKTTAGTHARAGREEVEMPAKNVEQLKARAGALKKKISAKGAAMAGPELRKLKKKVRRVQRKRRRLVSAAERVAKAGKKEKAE
jgi:hypothetical protein